MYKRVYIFRHSTHIFNVFECYRNECIFILVQICLPHLCLWLLYLNYTPLHSKIARTLKDPIYLPFKKSSGAKSRPNNQTMNTKVTKPLNLVLKSLFLIFYIYTLHEYFTNPVHAFPHVPYRHPLFASHEGSLVVVVGGGGVVVKNDRRGEVGGKEGLLRTTEFLRSHLGVSGHDFTKLY